jgi:transcriptional regulator with XRE-family HTH domain
VFLVNTNRTTPVASIALALPEARADHGLSQRELARLSGVSASTVRPAEAGAQIHPALLVRLGTTLVVLDAYWPPHFDHDGYSLLQAATNDGWAA